MSPMTFPKITIITMLLFGSFGAVVLAGSQDSRLIELVDQLNGKACKYEIDILNKVCVERQPAAASHRRHDKEYCIIDAAQALGMMGSRAQPAVPALIEALNRYHNLDSGDGIISVRSEIALALGMIGDPAAIKPLIKILLSNDPVTLLASASVPAYHKPFERTSHGDVAQALGMYGPQAKEAAIYIVPLLKYCYFRFTVAQLEASLLRNSLKNNRISDAEILQKLGLTAQTVDNASDQQLADALNQVLDRPDFYALVDSQIDNSLLPKEIQALLRGVKTRPGVLDLFDSMEINMLNRALLEQIYPHEIEKSLEYSGFNYKLKNAPWQAANALGQIKAVESIPALIEYLNNPRYKLAAIEVLAEFGSQAKEALPILEKIEKEEQSNYPKSAGPEQNGFDLKLRRIREAIKKISQ